MNIVYRKLGKHKAHGLAWKDSDLIEIDERLKGLEQLETIVHEVLHIQNKKWPEIKITGHAKEMAKLLWEQGYRKVDL